MAECDSVKPAYQAILQLQPQLVFLDIEMPNGNGFDLLQMFKLPTFKVIFETLIPIMPSVLFALLLPITF